jgi:hypothetical protein
MLNDRLPTLAVLICDAWQPQTTPVHRDVNGRQQNVGDVAVSPGYASLDLQFFLPSLAPEISINTGKRPGLFGKTWIKADPALSCNN